MREPVLNRDYVVVPTYDELKERIAKAKGILEETLSPQYKRSLEEDMRFALAALEGK